MKLTIFILLVTCLHVSANVSGQITYSGKDVPLEKIFTEIKKQTGFYFLYDPEVIKNVNGITLNVKNASVEEVMQLCLKNLPLEYKILDKTIFIITKQQVKNETTQSNDNPASEISGVVLDEEGNPIEGVTVLCKSTKAITSTNVKGEFTLKDVDFNSTLTFTSIGYEQKTIALKNKNAIAVELKIAVKGLDQTVVIGYGQTTQRLSTGSVSKITSEEISKQPVTNPLLALEGRVPGLTVTQSSGTPGANLKIQIRGQNSLLPTSSGNPIFDNPLFIIDGVPFAPQNTNLNQHNSLVAYGNSSGPGVRGFGPFNSINPADIESIEILRDADATAIYGSRGANGVILITTKKGTSGKTKFGGNVWTGASTVTRTEPMMNIKQYLTMRHEAFKNDGMTPSTDPSDPGYAPDLLIYDTTRDMDWKKYFLGGTAKTTDANLFFSGGSANTQFLLGGGYHHETFIYPGNFSDNRASVNANIHHSSIDKKLTLDFTANYSFENNNSSSQPLLWYALTTPPDYPQLLNQDGSINWNYKGDDLSGNPMGFMKEPYNLKNYNLIGHFLARYELFKGFFIQSSFGYNSFNANETTAFPIAAQDPAQGPVSQASFSTNNFQSWIIEPQMEYKHPLLKGILNLLFGATIQKNINNSTDDNGYNYSNDLLLGSLNGAASIVSTNASSQYRYNAVFGRLNYIWSSKYILNLNIRRDGSSRFGPGNQFGNFGSLGLGWIFSEEPFIKNNLPFISFGKIKGSYGTAGNDNVGNYKYLSYYAPITSGTYGGTVGYRPQNLYNPDFSWSLTKKLESGIEIGLFKNRVFLTATWYRNRSNNQLVTYTLPSQAGFTGVVQNAPYTVQNKGWEFIGTTTNIKSKNFTWSSTFNLSIPKNVLLSFPNLSNSPYANTYVVGKSLTVLNKFISAGVNDTTGVFQFYSGKTTTYYPTDFTDYQVIGNLDPKFFGGINNRFIYKNFQFDFFFQFVKQTGTNYLFDIYNNFLVGYRFNLPTAFLSRWQQPGDHSNIQQVSTSFGSNAYNANYYLTASNAVYSDASFIRLKTISLSYNLPKNILEKIKMDAAKIYLNAQNLFTITNFKGSDPETQGYFALPPLRTITAGLQLTF